MVDVVYSSDDLTVVGGPSSINVNVSSGSRGIRGSRIYSISADPRTLTTQELPSDLLEYDLAIVVDADTQDAFAIYQKTGTSPQDWEPLPPLALNVFSTKTAIAFNEFGIAIAPIPVSLIFDLEDYSVDKFVVQYQLEDTNEGGNTYPVSSSISLSVVPDLENNIQNLVAVIKAVEFNGTSWVPITSALRTIHAFITVI